MPRTKPPAHPVVTPEFLTQLGRAAFGDSYLSALGRAITPYNPTGSLVTPAMIRQWIAAPGEGHHRSIPSWLVNAMPALIGDIRRLIARDAAERDQALASLAIVVENGGRS